MKGAAIPMIALALVVASGAANSSAQYIRTTNIFPAADATIASSSPDINYGSSTMVMIGVSSDGSSLSRALFRFDLSGIPTNASVSNVTFGLVAASQPSHLTGYGPSVVLSNWSEAGVTWNSRSLSVPWSAPGGQSGADFLSYASAIIDFAGPGITNQIVDNGGNPYYGLAHDVQAWVSDPSENFGWILAADDETTAGSVIQLESREAAAGQPVLTVGYSLPFTPAVISAPGATNGLFCFTFNTEPFHGYVVQMSDDLSGTNWHTRLVVDPLLAPVQFPFCDPITNSSRFYRVRTE
jgi:Disaggregatase related repeat